jgi:hypothetical protein
MFETGTMLRLLGACVLGGCFAVAVILNSVPG